MLLFHYIAVISVSACYPGLVALAYNYGYGLFHKPNLTRWRHNSNNEALRSPKPIGNISVYCFKLLVELNSIV